MVQNILQIHQREVVVDDDDDHHHHYHHPHHVLLTSYTLLRLMSNPSCFFRHLTPNSLKQYRTTIRQNHPKAANIMSYGGRQHIHKGSNPEYYNLLQQAVKEVWAISLKCQSNYGRVRLIICQVRQEQASPHCEMQQTPQSKGGVMCFLYLQRLCGGNKRNCSSVGVLEDINLPQASQTDN